MIKAGIFLLAIIIVGVVSIMLLDPGSDLYNNYNSLYSSSQKVNSKSKFTKEYNYVLESGNTEDNSGSINQGAVIYVNQAMAGKVGEIGGWEGSNTVAGANTICVACSGCGPTSLVEFELQQGKLQELANPEKMMIYQWESGGMSNDGTDQDGCGHGVNAKRQMSAGNWGFVDKYAKDKGYKYETLPKDCWGNSDKTREWYVSHLEKGHWVINLLGVGQKTNGHNFTGKENKDKNKIFKTAGHFVAFYGVSAEGDPIVYDTGSSSRNGVPINWDDLWHDSRSVSNDSMKATFMTAIWNEDVQSGGTSDSGTNTGVTADGELKLEASMKFANRVWKKKSFQDMTCYAFKSTVTTKKNFTVFVDAGHGSDPLGLSSKDEYIFPTADNGVGGQGDKGEGFQLRGTGESEFNIDIALKVKDLLLAEGYDVVMSRTGADRKISNGAVGIMASSTSDLLISIHWNGSSNGSASGVITFYTDRTAISAAGYDYSKIPKEWGSDGQMVKSKELAEMMTSSIVDGTALKRNGSGTRSEYERVLGYSTIPSVLVETGFGDNSGDRVILDNKRDDIAKAYVDGINKYYNKYK